MKNKHGRLYLAVLHTWSTINRIYSHRKYIPPFESTLSGKLIEHDKMLAEYRHSLVVSSSKGLITVQNSCNLFQQHKHSRVRETHSVSLRNGIGIAICYLRRVPVLD